MISKIEQGLQTIALDYSGEQLEKLHSYIELLQKWNATYNLVADSSEDELIYRHLFDCLAINSILAGNSFLDFGTGAGFPGIPLAIMNPHRTFVLLDSNGKKTRFLFQVKTELSLGNVTIENCRIEHYKCNDQIDIVMCRAFSSLPQMVEMTENLLDNGSRLLAMKGHVPQDEIDEIDSDYEVANIHQVSILNSEAARHVIEIGRKH